LFRGDPCTSAGRHRAIGLSYTLANRNEVRVSIEANIDAIRGLP